ncbi:hypothetical protein C2857_001650 [Epichloe festucae Fl1]|uniref:Uncharacterized protein n=1 Tax=Epichloe festucae (strain Fl1) TaxID=877507 RepID=A0A7S9KND1_EPIFF|nr:hypothetical protein C2857_001650 [Epichloe festucae Fl1]
MTNSTITLDDNSSIPTFLRSQRICCRAFRIGAVFDNVDVCPTQSRWTAYGRFDTSSKALVAAVDKGNKCGLRREFWKSVMEVDITLGGQKRGGGVTMAMPGLSSASQTRAMARMPTEATTLDLIAMGLIILARQKFRQWYGWRTGVSERADV